MDRLEIDRVDPELETQNGWPDWLVPMHEECLCKVGRIET